MEEIISDMQPSAQHPIAYFCAEFGLSHDLPLYAGGLGILAGDTVKQAADSNVPMVALGLLYRGCGNQAQVDEQGLQYEVDVDVDPVTLGYEHVYSADNQPLFVNIHLTNNNVWARVWKKSFGQVVLYLLDTDTDQNDANDRKIACAIYNGSEEEQLMQQMVLGIGGVKVLKALGVEPSVYHVNEGRPAFLFWQLIRGFMDNDHLPYEEARAKAQSLIVYTNHTLVRAGNNSFDVDLLKANATYYAHKMGVTIEQLLAPGFDPSTGAFSMTQFALNISKKASAVSQVHYELSKTLWPEYDWVGITNGIHAPTWQDETIKQADLSGDQLWWNHLELKKKLATYVGEKTGSHYDPNRLVIGWARRIATYKRPNAIFEDIQRIKAILMHTDRPVQFLLSGKAHARDITAKQLLADMIHLMKQELEGHAVFIPNYNMDVANHLVKGVDVWLNTPIYGEEASGTSGMKAIANGVLQLTVEDGWAAEVEWHDLGWSLDSNHLAPTLYLRLEKDVVPLYYDKDQNGVPQGWLSRMKKTLELSKRFTTQRMLDEYMRLLYA
jgi:starch phosphorylase